VPLRIGTRVIGVIAIYQLLTRRSASSRSTSSCSRSWRATPLRAVHSKLYQRSEKKLSGDPGVLDLLTAPTPQRRGDHERRHLPHRRGLSHHAPAAGFSLRRLKECRIIEAVDGVDALKKLTTERVDLVITDIKCR